MPDAGAAARPAITRLPVPTIAEGWALAVAALSLLILYGSNGMAREVGRDFAANPAAAAWLFMPHLILIAVIISGLRPLAALLQAFILTFACLIGLGAWVSSIGSSHASEGVGLFVALRGSSPHVLRCTSALPFGNAITTVWPLIAPAT